MSCLNYIIKVTNHSLANDYLRFHS